jgi:hypothetical protein
MSSHGAGKWHMWCAEVLLGRRRNVNNELLANILLFGSLAMIGTIVVILQIYKGEVSTGKLWPATRKNDPIVFWLGIVIQLVCVVGMWLFIASMARTDSNRSAPASTSQDQSSMQRHPSISVHGSP